MRLWTLSPCHLDPKGLVALWRESLLAQAALGGSTRGYTSHPQLDRFRGRPGALTAYLWSIHGEASKRGYHFDSGRIRGEEQATEPIPVGAGQVLWEREHLARKLQTRATEWAKRLPVTVETNPVFQVVSGGIEPWERQHGTGGG